ncbi:MAG: ATPase, T2SS/T4P/T4SS family [Haloferacaceae archaeon]
MRLPDRGDDPDDCRCESTFETRPGAGDRYRTELHVDADDCPGGGDLVAAAACRATVVGALAERDADLVRTTAAGRTRAYVDDAAGFLLAAGRFVEEAAFHDEAIASLARRDPLAAAHEATGRAGPIRRIAAETGLAAGVERASGHRPADGVADEWAIADGETTDRETDGIHTKYARLLRSFDGPTLAQSRVDPRPPPGATLVDRRTLSTGATARLYESERGRQYHLTPVEHGLDASATTTLAAAYGELARGAVGGGERAPGRAVRRVAADDAPVQTLTAVLRKHTRGQGVLEDLFADDRVTDVAATAPVGRNPLWVTLDGDRLATNVRLTPRGAAALSSRLRLTSGRGFSRASPTVDATVDAGDERVRVAGVTSPASDGPGFAFRRRDEQPWTLPALVDNDTLPAEAAALLSVAVERGAAVLFAGPRGAGKTTLLGASLWELPATERVIAIEDTPELPVEALQETGRDVQALGVDAGDGPEPAPAAALRTALRLGEGALVVGEVRGEEARVLYEAMRVGDGDGAVLGTIHGAGGEAVRERVVTDLEVPESAFAATDLLVTAGADPHRVTRIEEVRATSAGVAFEELYESTAEGLAATGVVDRGNSHLVAALATADESYASVREAIASRTSQLRAESLGGTDHESVARRRWGSR